MQPVSMNAMEICTLLPYHSPPAVAVVGDICLDLYYFTGKEGAEVSVETGIQSYSVLETRQDLGGAGNVAANCMSLGAKRTDLYGLLGNDCWGMIVRDLLARRGIGSEGVVIQNEGWQTHVYHKIYKGTEELPRYDMGNQNRPLNEKIDALLRILESRLDEYQCVIINEQVPSGLHSPYFQERLAALAAANRDRVMWFTDCRKFNDRYNHTIRKLNIREARDILAANGAEPRYFDNAASTAAWLYKHWGLPVVLTLGEAGALVQDAAGCREINSIHFIKEIDIVGAGDAFLAGLVTACGAGLTLDEAALIGTFSAGVSLGKLFETGHPTAEEVIALAEEGDFNYHPCLAVDDGLAQYAPETEIEIVSRDFSGWKGSPLKAAIFDHDGTISVLRQGWEEVMYAMMVDSITGRFDPLPERIPDAREMAKVREAAASLIEKTTGIQTLAQMHFLKDLVVSFGYVQGGDVLSPEEYKAIYNTALMKSIEKRVRRVEEGKLSPADMTIKGAVCFLQKLAASGTKLYLASGTDQEDVVREARSLGYAHLFTGGIFGSAGDIKNDPKKLVIRDIVAGIKDGGGKAAEVAVFGDGPVEMREAKKAGFLAVGVLSDEQRRWGRNRNKRERLVLAGADILIPDFSWGDELARLCGWELSGG
ncbi:MAG: PfkB family carbohydrate kinase [Treponema sp.]|jgi:bifunctional ADP-heptose synthase (sugar kinase/adenylyltransferase)/phosphoglycolate phosphatase-like HAD superfamily hydrolase|nr:PfkB family carbohydrate kinase [Treponema sp.]